MDSRKHVDLNAILLMVLLCVIWAFQQVGFKATAHDAAPVLQIAIRSGVAAAVMWMLVRLRGGTIGLSGPVLRAGALAGLFFGVEFVLLGEAIKFTTASHVSVFLYVAPIVAAVGLHLKLPSEHLARPQWFGVLLSACGIAVAFLFHDDKGSGSRALSSMILGDLLAVAAGILWGATTIIVRTTVLATVPPTHTLFYQLAAGTAFLAAASLVTGQTAVEPTWQLATNLVYQSLIVASFSFLVWFSLLTTYRASQLGVFSFMTPVFGVVLGWLLLDEPLTGAFLTGAAGVLAGVVIVSAYPWYRQRRAARPGLQAPG